MFAYAIGSEGLLINNIAYILLICEHSSYVLFAPLCFAVEMCIRDSLGHDFLRHIERCRMLLHVIDISGTTGRDPIDDIEKINCELCKFSQALANLPQILIANKCDAVTDPTTADRIKEYAAEKKLELIFISAATKQNINQMILTVQSRLLTLPPVVVYETEFVDCPEKNVIDRENHDVEIRREGNTFYVEAEWLWRLVGSVNFEDRDSLRYFQRVLKSSGEMCIRDSF